jgi:hypothetical protein
VGCKLVPGAANGVNSGLGDTATPYFPDKMPLVGGQLQTGAGCLYRNPTIEYIWPENIPGGPPIENNFNSE